MHSEQYLFKVEECTNALLHLLQVRLCPFIAFSNNFNASFVAFHCIWFHQLSSVTSALPLSSS